MAVFGIERGYFWILG